MSEQHPFPICPDCGRTPGEHSPVEDIPCGVRSSKTVSVLTAAKITELTTKFPNLGEDTFVHERDYNQAENGRVGKDAEIARLTRELEIQKAVVELAYIPHRSLVESRDRADAEIARLRPMAESWGSYEAAQERKAEMRLGDETEVARPQLGWEVTYDVVAYNESWGGYGDNASKAGFQSAEEAIAYAKPLGAHLDATVWQRTKPKSVVAPPSIKIWSAENGKGDLRHVCGLQGFGRGGGSENDVCPACSPSSGGTS